MNKIIGIVRHTFMTIENGKGVIPILPNYLFLVFLCVGNVFAGGVSATVQKAWNALDDSYVYSAGYMHLSESWEYVYYEGGVVLLPASRSGVMLNERGQYSRRYTNSAYGFYGGSYFYLMPILRPGLLIGTTVKDNATYSSIDGNDFYLHSYGDFKLDYYIAFSLQVGMVQFIISNYGIGGGLNYFF